MKNRTATFTAEQQPDFTVRISIAPANIVMSLQDGLQPPTVYNFPANASPLQLAEGMQFLADVISEEVPGRWSPFRRGWNNVAQDVHANAVDKGFWPEEGRNDGEMLALIHSEISEALEAIRAGNPPDDKIPEFTGVEVELADAVIRIMDMAIARQWRVAEAIEAKMAFNKTRAFKHGKAFLADDIFRAGLGMADDVL